MADLRYLFADGQNSPLFIGTKFAPCYRVKIYNLPFFIWPNYLFTPFLLGQIQKFPPFLLSQNSQFNHFYWVNIQKPLIFGLMIKIYPVLLDQNKDFPLFIGSIFGKRET